MTDLTVRPLELPVPARPSVVGRVHPGPVALTGALFAAPLFLNDYWIFTVAAGLTLGISCLGLQVLLGWSRQISLMHAGVTGAATYLAIHVTYLVYISDPPESVMRRTSNGRVLPQPTAPGPESMLIGGLAAVMFATALYFTVGLIVRRLAAMYVIALTFAVQFAIENTLFTQEVLTGGASRPTVPRPEILGVGLSHDRRMYWFIALMLLLVILALHRLRDSRVGRAIAFSGRDPEAAAAAGISPWRYRAIAFGLAGLCAGMSGALQSPLFISAPGILQYMSVNSLVYLAVVVLAGSVSLFAVVAVALAFHLTPYLLLDWELNVYLVGGLGMVLGLLLGPRGIGGPVVDLFTLGRIRRPSLCPKEWSP